MKDKIETFKNFTNSLKTGGNLDSLITTINEAVEYCFENEILPKKKIPFTELPNEVIREIQEELKIASSDVISNVNIEFKSDEDIDEPDITAMLKFNIFPKDNEKTIFKAISEKDDVSVKFSDNGIEIMMIIDKYSGNALNELKSKVL